MPSDYDWSVVERAGRKWFAPIRVLVMHSSGEAMHAQRWNRWQIVASTLRDGDILVTTYQGLRMSSKLILPHSWGYVILDEGHKIRNPDAAITLVCKSSVASTASS